MDIVTYLRGRASLADPRETVFIKIGLISVMEAADEIERLREALRKAIDEVETWGGSTSPFLQEKHDLEGVLADLRAALGEGK